VKNSIIEEKDLDIEIIQESEKNIEIRQDDLFKKNQYSMWIGLHDSKGVRISSKIPFRIMNEYSDKYRIIVPVLFEYEHPFIILAVWTQRDGYGSYTKELLEAIYFYKSLYSAYPCFYMGDFNSNQCFDLKNRYSFHMKIVQTLNKEGFTSIYHSRNKVNHGNEMEPTFFLQRNQAKAFHIDYCFCPDNYSNRIIKFEIGKPEDWLKYSDHMPIEINIDI